MRDWNVKDPIEGLKEEIRFVEYLWGIETMGLLSFISPPFKFVEYLWGIETFYA